MNRIVAKILLLSMNALFFVGCGGSQDFNQVSGNNTFASPANTSLSKQEARPGDSLTINVPNPPNLQLVSQQNENDTLCVRFSDNKDFNFKVPATRTGTSFETVVPPYFSGKEITEGEDVVVTLEQVTDSGAVELASFSGFTILNPERTFALNDGVLITALLDASFDICKEEIERLSELDPTGNDAETQRQLTILRLNLKLINELNFSITSLLNGDVEEITINIKGQERRFDIANLRFLESALSALLLKNFDGVSARGDVLSESLKEFFTSELRRDAAKLATFIGPILTGIGVAQFLTPGGQLTGAGFAAVGLVLTAIGEAGNASELNTEQLAQFEELFSEFQLPAPPAFEGQFAGTLTITGGACNALSFPFTLSSVDNGGTLTGTYNVTNGDSGSFTGTFNPVTRGYTAFLDNGAVNVGTLNPDGTSYSGTYVNGPDCLIDGLPTRGAVSGNKVN